MKYLVYIFIATLSLACANRPKHSVSVLLYDNNKPIRVFDSNGDSIGVISNDIDNDMFVLLEVYSIAKGHAYITAKYAFNDTFALSGYIKNDVLGIRTLNKDTIFLYNSPKKSAIIVDTILNAEWSDLYRVLDMKNKWLYIEKNKNNHSIRGWLSPQDQCPDPVTISC